MAIQRINIEQQFAEIGIKSTPAKLNIRKPRGQMTIKNTRAQMRVESQAPTFTVNKQKMRSDRGLGGPLEFARNFRDKGKQTALRAAGQAKNDGNYLGNLKNKGDRVSSLAKQKQMQRLGPKETNIGLIPKEPPEVTWEKGYMRIDWSRHSVVIDFSGEYMPDMSVDPPHSVEVFLRRAPYFRVMVEEAVGPTGRHVNSVT